MMKKILLALLLVGITLCLFVSCDDNGPKTYTFTFVEEVSGPIGTQLSFTTDKKVWSELLTDDFSDNSYCNGTYKLKMSGGGDKVMVRYNGTSYYMSKESTYDSGKNVLTTATIEGGQYYLYYTVR